MKKTNALRQVLVLMLIVSIAACKTPESKENSAPQMDAVIDSTLDQGSINLKNNSGVNFEYELSEPAEFGENFFMEIECKLTNTTDQEINYLNQSCNGLVYYLIIVPDSHEVMPFIQCNATWAKISQLAPRDSLKFKTQILSFKHAEPIEKIGIDFRVMDKFIPYDTLRENPELVEKVYRSETQIENVIWGVEN